MRYFLLLVCFSIPLFAVKKGRNRTPKKKKKQTVLIIRTREAAPVGPRDTASVKVKDVEPVTVEDVASVVTKESPEIFQRLSDLSLLKNFELSLNDENLRTALNAIDVLLPLAVPCALNTAINQCNHNILDVLHRSEVQNLLDSNAIESLNHIDTVGTLQFSNFIVGGVFPHAMDEVITFDFPTHTVGTIVKILYDFTFYATLISSFYIANELSNISIDNPYNQTSLSALNESIQLASTDMWRYTTALLFYKVHRSIQSWCHRIYRNTD